MLYFTELKTWVVKFYSFQWTVLSVSLVDCRLRELWFWTYSVMVSCTLNFLGWNLRFGTLKKGKRENRYIKTETKTCQEK